MTTRKSITVTVSLLLVATLVTACGAFGQKYLDVGATNPNISTREPEITPADTLPTGSDFSYNRPVPTAIIQDAPEAPEFFKEFTMVTNNITDKLGYTYTTTLTVYSPEIGKGEYIHPDSKNSITTKSNVYIIPYTIIVTNTTVGFDASMKLLGSDLPNYTDYIDVRYFDNSGASRLFEGSAWVSYSIPSGQRGALYGYIAFEDQVTPNTPNGLQNTEFVVAGGWGYDGRTGIMGIGRFSFSLWDDKYFGATSFAQCLIKKDINGNLIVTEYPTERWGEETDISVTTTYYRENTALSESMEVPDMVGSTKALRESGKYTFIILGLFEGGGTDIMTTATFDINNRTLEVVSIPRNTLVNVSWDTKQACTIYANMIWQHRNDNSALALAMDATVDEFAGILGYQVDYLSIIDARAFTALIDAIGGVDFYLPRNIYPDEYQGISANYSSGMQHFDGTQALDVVKSFRIYPNGDIGRIETLQSFLKAAAQQIHDNKDSVNTVELANTFCNYVRTDLELSNLIWFINEFLKLEENDISFSIMPGNYQDYVAPNPYATILLDEWLKLVNEKLNPFTTDITQNDVSILTRGEEGVLFVTDGNWQTDPQWGANS